ncbi:unnamed protein product, partial [Nesidiocoris tenuis]
MFIFGSQIINFHMLAVLPKIKPFSFGDERLYIGQSIQLGCFVIEGDDPIRIIWDIGGERNLDEFDIETSKVGRKGSVIAIEYLQSHHAGIYRCTASNEAGSRSWSSVLSISVPPRWIIEPTDKAFAQGSDAKVECKADGFPKPSVTWKRASGDSPGDYKDLKPNNPDVKVEDGTLHIHNIQKVNEGYYLCEAVNGIGSGLSAVIMISVQAPPQFEVKMRNQTARINDPTVLQCEAKGEKPIGILWNMNNKRLDPKNDVRYTIREEILPNGVLSDLSIRSTGREDSALFTCVATNSFGSDDSSINLIVQGSWDSDVMREMVPGHQTMASVFNLNPATTYHMRVVAENEVGTSEHSEPVTIVTAEEAPSGPPMAVKVEAIDQVTLKVTWKPPERDAWNGEIQGYYVGYKLTASDKPYLFETVEFSKEEGREHHLLISNLKTYTQYSVVVQAFNKLGAGPMSEEKKQYTAEGIPEQPPHDPVCTTLTSETIRVSWTPPPAVSANGVIKGYKVIYGPSDTWYDEKSKDSKITASSETIIHGLKKFTNYSMQVLAYTAGGDGVRSSPIHCQTEQDVPARIASFDSHFTATYREDVKLPCLAVGKPTPDIKWKIKGTSFESNDRMQQLPEGSLLIKSVNRGDAGEYSCSVENSFGRDSVTHHLIILAPPHVPQITLTSTTTNSITMKLKPNPADTEPIHGYTIKYKPEFGDWETIQLAPTVHKYTLENLWCGSRYMISVVAYNSIGTGDESDLLNTRTKGSKPIIPEASRFIEVSTNSITLHLSTWSDGGCPMLYFVVEHKKKYDRSRPRSARFGLRRRFPNQNPPVEPEPRGARSVSTARHHRGHHGHVFPPRQRIASQRRYRLQPIDGRRKHDRQTLSRPSRRTRLHPAAQPQGMEDTRGWGLTRRFRPNTTIQRTAMKMILTARSIRHMARPTITTAVATLLEEGALLIRHFHSLGSPEPPPPPPRNHDSSANDSKESNEMSEAECDRDMNNKNYPETKEGTNNSKMEGSQHTILWQCTHPPRWDHRPVCRERVSTSPLTFTTKSTRAHCQLFSSTSRSFGACFGFQVRFSSLFAFADLLDENENRSAFECHPVSERLLFPDTDVSLVRKWCSCLGHLCRCILITSRIIEICPILDSLPVAESILGTISTLTRRARSCQLESQLSIVYLRSLYATSIAMSDNVCQLNLCGLYTSAVIITKSLRPISCARDLHYLATYCQSSCQSLLHSVCILCIVTAKGKISNLERRQLVEGTFQLLHRWNVFYQPFYQSFTFMVTDQSYFHGTDSNSCMVLIFCNSNSSTTDLMNHM